MFSVVRMLHIYCVSVDSLNFSGENSDQVGKVGLQFRRQRKAGMTLGADHTKETWGDDAENGRPKSKPWEKTLPTTVG